MAHGAGWSARGGADAAHATTAVVRRARSYPSRGARHRSLARIWKPARGSGAPVAGAAARVACHNRARSGRGVRPEDGEHHTSRIALTGGPARLAGGFATAGRSGERHVRDEPCRPTYGRIDGEAAALESRRAFGYAGGESVLTYAALEVVWGLRLRLGGRFADRSAPAAEGRAAKATLQGDRAAWPGSRLGHGDP
jgi:hypothetical protein